MLKHCKSPAAVLTEQMLTHCELLVSDIVVVVRVGGALAMRRRFSIDP
jgi:hypothetical protein